MNDDQLYREYILEHYKRPHNWGQLEHPDMEAQDLNPLCGDELKVQLAVDDGGRITDVAFSGHGCAISQAAASMISDEVKGMKVEELLTLDREAVLELLGIDISRAANEVRDARAQSPQERLARPPGRVGAGRPLTPTAGLTSVQIRVLR